MREILFRGKRAENGKWVEGVYFKHDTVCICFSSDDPKPSHLIIQDGFCDWGFEPPIQGIEVIPETIGQYTGLTDKNGKKIFEGDIVKGSNIMHSNRKIYQVAFDDGAFELFDHKGVGWHHSHIDNKEVIGNIHDNPELLKGERK